MEKQQSPIGVFDSGMGGISVLKELYRIMPNEDYIYYGDSKHAPYGTKTLEEVRVLSFANTEHLLEQGAKALVVACNTATSAAVRLLRKKYPFLPIVGIEPALKPAAMQPGHPRVLVMATPMTIREEKFQNLLKKYDKNADVIGLPCPGLMEFVEAGDTESGELHAFLEELLSPYLHQIDSIVLGCTHYPFVRPMIQELAGERVRIYDGGNGTAREMRRRLQATDLINPKTEPGKVVFENSRETEEEIALSEKLFQKI